MDLVVNSIGLTTRIHYSYFFHIPTKFVAIRFNRKLFYLRNVTLLDTICRNCQCHALRECYVTCFSTWHLMEYFILHMTWCIYPADDPEIDMREFKSLTPTKCGLTEIWVRGEWSDEKINRSVFEGIWWKISVHHWSAQETYTYSRSYTHFTSNKSFVLTMADGWMLSVY